MLLAGDRFFGELFEIGVVEFRPNRVSRRVVQDDFYVGPQRTLEELRRQAAISSSPWVWNCDPIDSPTSRTLPLTLSSRAQPSTFP